MEKVNQHYVPQFYLKNFSQNSKSINMYMHNSKKYICNASIKEQASKKHFYGKDLVIENIFMEIEAKVSPILKEIINTDRFSDDMDANLLILLFMLLLEARTLKIAESQTNASNYINQVLGNDIKSRDTHIPNLCSLAVASESLPILYDLSMALITAGNNGQFITTDTPVCRYNLMYVLRDYALKGYGLSNVGAQFFLPISPKHCLYLFDPEAYGVTTEIVEIGQHDINELNKLFYLNSYQYLFFNPFISQEYIRDLSKDLVHKNNVEDETSRFGDLIIRSQNHVKDLIQLSFITLNKETISMPLPAHMAGPMRPHAEKAMKVIDQERKKYKKERKP